ncbi:hypothetical protein CFE70_006819 [Pyrenophora teres f. teres 0-1]
MGPVRQTHGSNTGEYGKSIKKRAASPLVASRTAKRANLRAGFVLSDDESEDGDKVNHDAQGRNNHRSVRRQPSFSPPPVSLQNDIKSIPESAPLATKQLNKARLNALLGRTKPKPTVASKYAQQPSSKPPPLTVAHRSAPSPQHQHRVSVQANNKEDANPFQGLVAVPQNMASGSSWEGSNRTFGALPTPKTADSASTATQKALQRTTEEVTPSKGAQPKSFLHSILKDAEQKTACISRERGVDKVKGTSLMPSTATQRPSNTAQPRTRDQIAPTASPKLATQTASNVRASEQARLKVAQAPSPILKSGPGPEQQLVFVSAADSATKASARTSSVETARKRKADMIGGGNGNGTAAAVKKLTVPSTECLRAAKDARARSEVSLIRGNLESVAIAHMVPMERDSAPVRKVVDFGSGLKTGNTSALRTPTREPSSLTSSRGSVQQQSRPTNREIEKSASPTGPFPPSHTNGNAVKQATVASRKTMPTKSLSQKPIQIPAKPTATPEKSSTDEGSQRGKAVQVSQPSTESLREKPESGAYEKPAPVVAAQHPREHLLPLKPATTNGYVVSRQHATTKQRKEEVESCPEETTLQATVKTTILEAPKNMSNSKDAGHDTSMDLAQQEHAATKLPGAATTGDELVPQAQHIEVSQRKDGPIITPAEIPLPQEQIPTTPNAVSTLAVSIPCPVTLPTVTDLVLHPSYTLPSAEPYFEYSIFHKSWSTPHDESTANSTEISVRTFTNIDTANAQADKFHNATRTSLGSLVEEQSCKRDENGCTTHMLTHAHPFSPSQKTHVQFFVRRDQVSKYAGRTANDLEGARLVSSTAYAVRLYKLIPNPETTNGSETDDNDDAAANREDTDESLIRTTSHPHVGCPNIYTTLSSANRAALALQVTLSHEANPTNPLTMDFQTRGLRALQEKLEGLGVKGVVSWRQGAGRVSSMLLVGEGIGWRFWWRRWGLLGRGICEM